MSVAVERAPSSTRLGRVLFWTLLLLLALGARLIDLDGRGVWQDEGLTLYQVRLPFDQILANRIPVAQFMTRNTVPPLYFLILGAWGRLAGTSIWALRLFSVFSMVLVAPLLYRAGAWMGDRRAGRVAALLAVISPFYLWYAQELRMYAFLMVPVTFSMALLWRWYHRWRAGAAHRGWFVAYLASVAAMLGTHYLSLFLVGAQGLWLALLLARRRPRLLWLLVPLAGLALPLVPFGLEWLGRGPERDFFFQPLDRILRDLLNAFSFGPTGLISRPDEIWYLFPLVLALLALGLVEARRRGGFPLALLLALTLLAPIVTLFVASMVKPLYQNARHLMIVSPPFYLLWGFGLSGLARRARWAPLLVVPLLAIGWGIAFDRYFDPPAPLKNDVRPLFELLADRVAPGDVVVLNDPVLQHPFEYFAPGVPWVVLPPYARPLEEAGPAYRALTDEYDRAWYVYGPPDTSFDTWEHLYYWLFDRYNRLEVVDLPGQTIVAATLFDLQGPLYSYDPLEPARPATQRFVEGIAYRGLAEPLPVATAGETLVIESLWFSERQPSQDYELVARLVDGAERLWFEQRLVPYEGIHRVSHWQPAQWLRVPLRLALPETLPAADYRLTLHLLDPAGRSIFAEGQGAPLEIGRLPVAPATNPARLEGRRAGGLEIEVAPLADRLPPAPTLEIEMRVRRLESGPLPDRLRLVARDGSREELWATDVALTDGLPRREDGAPVNPPESWAPGEIVPLRFAIPLPPTLEGRLGLEMALLAGERPLDVERWGPLAADSVGLGAVEIAARERRVAPPPLDVGADATWPGAGTLLGYARGDARGDGTIPLTLAWRAGSATDRPYKVFLHLLDADGGFVTGADAFFDVPSIAWVADEIVLSEHGIPTAGLAPGTYTLSVGLYHEASGERLPLDGGGDALPLGAFEVAP